MKLIGIAGYKNSGKTTLIAELIREFTGRGLRVATIKHAHHEFDIDHQGKDSFEHRAAGAKEVLVVSKRRWAQIFELDGMPEPTLDEHLARLNSPDLVLIEGYKHGDHPKLEIRRAELEHPRIAGQSVNVIAVVSDQTLVGEALPVLPRGDVTAIADFIAANAVKRAANC